MRTWGNRFYFLMHSAYIKVIMRFTKLFIFQTSFPLSPYQTVIREINQINCTYHSSIKNRSCETQQRPVGCTKNPSSKAVKLFSNTHYCVFSYCTYQKHNVNSTSEKRTRLWGGVENIENNPVSHKRSYDNGGINGGNIFTIKIPN